MHFITGSASDILIIHLDKASRRGVTTRETAWLSFCNLASAYIPDIVFLNLINLLSEGEILAETKHFFFHFLQTYNFSLVRDPSRLLPQCLQTFHDSSSAIDRLPSVFNVYKLSRIFVRPQTDRPGHFKKPLPQIYCLAR